MKIIIIFLIPSVLLSCSKSDENDSQKNVATIVPSKVVVAYDYALSESYEPTHYQDKKLACAPH